MNKQLNLSTNDATHKKSLGTMHSDIFDIESFDTHTIAGAIEYITAYVKQNWDCPIVFFTNPKYENEHYEQMVSLLHRIVNKWDIAIIDLWTKSITNANLCTSVNMSDAIHPTFEGYKNEWEPIFADFIKHFYKPEV